MDGVVFELAPAPPPVEVIELNTEFVPSVPLGEFPPPTPTAPTPPAPTVIV
jgi:hypothetical protein